MFGVVQLDKVRPIVNLSAPEGLSYNDAIKPLPKVHMDSAKKISQRIFRKGRGTLMCKLDMVAAYKIVPTRPDQWRLQGFRWLQKYFIDTRLMFGSKSAVPNYDNLHAAIVIIAIVHSTVDLDDIFRILDDLITIGADPSFIAKYREVAASLNIPLAPLNGEKSFLFRTRGVLLGILYDTDEMTWSFTPLKILTYQYRFQQLLGKQVVTLKELQSVNGVINCVITQCPMLRFWRHPLIMDMKRAKRATPRKVTLSKETIGCLNNWLRILESLLAGFPIPKPLEDIINHDWTFTTDASGLGKNTIGKVSRGVGACGFPCWKKRSALYVGQAFWPPQFVTKFDERGKFVGCKTTMLETVGFFVALYHNRHKLRNVTILIYVDNKASCYAFAAGRSKIDDWASMLLEALALILIELESSLEVRHCKRRSTDHSELADDLTRGDKKGRVALLKHKNVQYGWPPHSVPRVGKN